MVAAQNDDRHAFDHLKKIAEDKNNHFADLAGRAWLTIFEARSGPISQTGFQVPWVEGIDPAKLSLEELEHAYDSAAEPIKPGLLEYIWNRNDVPKGDRMEFMMELMKKDSSLTAAEYAGRHFTEGAGLRVKPMALDYLSDWWDKHRNEFAGK